jgi:DNA-binding GntR family transcriptional regulator
MNLKNTHTNTSSKNNQISDLVMATIPRSLKLSEAAAEMIRAEIVGGRLLPGSRVTISSIAKILGISNTPVREAFIRLAEVGLAEFDGSSIRIVGETNETLHEAFELRAQLEAMTARQAAIKRSPAEAKALLELAVASRKAAQDGDQPTFRKLDMKFHGSVAALTGNRFLEKYACNAYDLATTLRNVRKLSRGFQADAAYMHVQLAEAILDQNAKLAETIGRKHVETVFEQMTKFHDDQDTRSTKAGMKMSENA